MKVTITDDETGLTLSFDEEEARKLIKVDFLAGALEKDRDSFRYYLNKHGNNIFEAMRHAAQA
ncbi:hypothetical protein [Pantoea sp. ME81]|uniref:hypothetical protein n=1 Tax=Pantoea sp. ME81 TaxID=2743935 RepID=UPI0015F391DA|nr:hypothetical protein [Pantoea sp. ME81]